MRTSLGGRKKGAIHSLNNALQETERKKDREETKRKRRE